MKEVTMLSKNAKKRIIIILFINILAIIISFSYYILFSGSEGISCVIYSATGIYCPGCAGSRALFALLSFNLIKSFLLYPPIIISALILVVFDITLLISLIRKKDNPLMQLNPEITVVIPASILLFFIVRLVMQLLGFDLVEFALKL